MNMDMDMDMDTTPCAVAYHRQLASGATMATCTAENPKEGDQHVRCVAPIHINLLKDNRPWIDYRDILGNWLRECESHPRCKRTMSGRAVIDTRAAPLPTRCVEVLKRGYRLRKTGSGRGKYIIVSHHWAKDTAACSTTEDNIASRLLEWSGPLPTRFLDVIELARKLEVEYVWIDSLCIIQRGHDGVDFNRESLKMADYYQHAWFTVAITAKTAEDTLYPPEAPSPPTLTRLPYYNRACGMEGFLYVYLLDDETNRQYRESVQRSEVSNRGWVFQEWLLSKRIVYFTPYGMFLECQSTLPLSERQETVSQEALESDDVPRHKLQLFDHRTREHQDSVFRSWCLTVELYSHLPLTFPEKDRIKALAGVAK